MGFLSQISKMAFCHTAPGSGLTFECDGDSPSTRVTKAKKGLPAGRWQV